MINSPAWIAWVGAALVALSATRNPFYVGLILLWIALSLAFIPPAADTPPVPFSPLRFAAVVIALSALFNALTVHVGRTVLFRLPAGWLLIGGSVTLEALVYGMLNGLILSGIFAAFTLLNRVLPVRALIRLIPRAFYPVAIVISIAITFVPTTLRRFQQIKEAQAVRGHQTRSLRDWLPLLLPLLVGGLERALKLAEAMTARGFAGAGERAPHDAGTQTAIVAGLALVLAGWLLRLAWQMTAVGGAVLSAGGLVVLVTLWVVGRRVPHTSYRPEKWRKNDWLVLAGALVVIGAFLVPWPGLNRDSIFYYPYPGLTVPGFNALLGGATAGLLGPLALLKGGSAR